MVCAARTPLTGFGSGTHSPIGSFVAKFDKKADFRIQTLGQKGDIVPNRVADPYECVKCPLQLCEGLRSLDPYQLEYMQDFKQGEIRVDRGETLIEQGVHTHRLYTLIEGVLVRYRTLEDGRRQIVTFMFPGDLAGLHGAFDEPASHSVEALTEARVCVFERAAFASLIAEHPRLGYDLTWLAAKDEAALEEHLVSLGKRNAQERLVFFAVWLLDRALKTCMASEGNALSIPITQVQVADMLGLSLVHTNRTIKLLEREGLIEWEQGRIGVPDMDKASEFAQFDRSRDRPKPFI